MVALIQQGMTNEQLTKLVPAIGRESPDFRTSSMYRQIRTLDVVNVLRDQGWSPVRAKSLITKDPDRMAVGKHQIRFQQVGNTNLMTKVGDTTVELILTNSHDGKSCYRVMLGLFRLACTNGMIVSEGTFGEIHIRHVSFDPQQIVNASAEVGNSGHKLVDRVAEMKQIQLTDAESVAYATSAAGLVFDPDRIANHDIEVDPRSFLRVRRASDVGNSLWNVFNRVQENTIKGGILNFRRDANGKYGLNNGRYAKARTMTVKSIDTDIRLNQQLWALTEKMVELKKGG